MPTTPSDDGGPAFPVQDASKWQAHGMTLRDYFAVHAPAEEIEAMIPDTIAECAVFIGIATTEYRAATHYQHVLAKARHVWADAMLAARSK